MKVFNVFYTAYEQGSSMIISEGVMPITTESSNMAEAAVEAMFRGCEVIIRYTNEA
jgi:hypothetical protein